MRILVSVVLMSVASAALADNPRARPKLMILGSYHMASPGRDTVNMNVDDVLSARRQKEIEDVVARLAEFAPTRIAAEVQPSGEAKLVGRYRDYVNGKAQLSRNEIEQIGYRLAKRLGHDRIYAVDWNGSPGVPDAEIDYVAYAEHHPDAAALLASVRGIYTGLMAKVESLQKTGSVGDVLRLLNSENHWRQDGAGYLSTARIGGGDEYPGANWVQFWYGRNLKIFVNLTRLVQRPEERVLLVIGAGHLALLRHMADESGYFELVDPLRYLDRR